MALLCNDISHWLGRKPRISPVMSLHASFLVSSTQFFQHHCNMTFNILTWKLMSCFSCFRSGSLCQSRWTIGLWNIPSWICQDVSKMAPEVCRGTVWILEFGASQWNPSSTQTWVSNLLGFIIIPSASTKLKGGYTCFTLSVGLWTQSCPLCIFDNTRRIYFLFAHLINSLNSLNL